MARRKNMSVGSSPALVVTNEESEAAAPQAIGSKEGEAEE